MSGHRTRKSALIPADVCAMCWLRRPRVVRSAVGTYRVAAPRMGAPRPDEKAIGFCAECAEGWQHSGWMLVLVGAPVTPDELEAALARMDAEVNLPHEPKGSALIWAATEREYDDLRRQYPDDDDNWKRGAA